MWHELDGAQGWVYYYWALENEGGLFGAVAERKGAGYVKQEFNRLYEAIYGQRQK